MSEGSCCFRLEDKPNRDSGKVPNSTENCFIQGYSCTFIPYIYCLFIQSGKMSPNHKGEASGGDVSSVEVVLDILIYAHVSRMYTRKHVAHSGQYGHKRASPPAPTPLDPKGEMPSFNDRPGMGLKFYSYYTRLEALNMKGAARMQASGDERPRRYSGSGRQSCL
jgi:hypothetical protein